jgi:hypothetical protein
VIIAGHKNRINRVEILNGATWEEMVRGTDNGWMKGGLGGHASFEIKGSDIFGETVIVTGVYLNVADGHVIGTDNFTGCYITSEDEISSFDYISTFQNPANNQVTFEGIQKVTQILIVDTMLKVVATKNFNGGVTKTTLDISELKSGIHVTKMVSGNQLANTTNIIKK